MSDTSSFDLQYKDKLDPKYIFNAQIMRCLQLIDTPMFQNNVEALARLLPIASYTKITNRRKEWTPEEWKFEYDYAGPIKLGTLEKPIMAKIPGSNKQRYPIPYIDDEDGNTIIDWDDPHILSPRLVQKDEPNYLIFFQLIMEEAQYAGLTWDQDTATFKVDTITLKLSDKPTPYILKPEDEDDEEDREEEEPEL